MDNGNDNKFSIIISSNRSVPEQVEPEKRRRDQPPEDRKLIMNDMLLPHSLYRDDCYQIL